MRVYTCVCVCVCGGRVMEIDVYPVTRECGWYYGHGITVTAGWRARCEIPRGRNVKGCRKALKRER